MLMVNQLIGFGAVDVPAAQYNAVRFNFTTGATRQVAEIELRATVGGADFTPTMAGTTTSSFTCNGDSVFAGGQEAWRAFADDGTAAIFGSNGSSGACWIEMIFDTLRTVAQYTLQCPAGGTSFMPTQWDLKGSTDSGSSYPTTINSQTGLSWSTSEVKTFNC